MQYHSEHGTVEDCHSIEEVSRSADAQRLLRRAAARALGGSSSSADCEDLIADVVCGVLGGDIARDTRPILTQLVAEVAKRGRKQCRQAHGLPMVPLDEVPDTFLADSSEMPATPPRDARHIIATVRTLAVGEKPWVRSAVLWLLELQLERGTVAVDDALAAGLTPYQYRVACQRLGALCRVASTQREPTEASQIGHLAA